MHPRGALSPGEDMHEHVQINIAGATEPVAHAKRPSFGARPRRSTTAIAGPIYGGPRVVTGTRARASARVSGAWRPQGSGRTPHTAWLRSQTTRSMAGTLHEDARPASGVLEVPRLLDPREALPDLLFCGPRRPRRRLRHPRGHEARDPMAGQLQEASRMRPSQRLVYRSGPKKRPGALGPRTNSIASRCVTVK